MLQVDMLVHAWRRTHRGMRLRAEGAAPHLPLPGGHEGPVGPSDLEVLLRHNPQDHRRRMGHLQVPRAGGVPVGTTTQEEWDLKEGPGRDSRVGEPDHDVEGSIPRALVKCKSCFFICFLTLLMKLNSFGCCYCYYPTMSKWTFM
jgi:hypothetical protein